MAPAARAALVRKAGASGSPGAALPPSGPTILRDPVLWVILVMGLLLRLWKITGDLPYVFHYDEPTIVDNAVWMWQHGTLNPHFFNYPTGLIYLLAVLYGFIMAGGVLLSRFDGFAGAIRWLSSGTYPRPPEGGVLYFYPTVGVPLLYLIGRLISVAAGVVAIAAIYAIARRVSGSMRMARVAALFLAMSPLAVEHSHLITTDMVSATLATLALLAVIRAEGKGKMEWTLAGVLAGLAAGTKYNAGLTALILVVLAIWRVRQDRTGVIRLFLCGALGAVVAFIITTPYALLDSSRFLKDLSYEFHRVASITPTFRGSEAVEATPAEKVGGIIWHNLGIFGILAVIAGAIAAVQTKRFGPCALVLWVAIALLPMLRWESLYARYLLVPWPAMILLAAWGLEAAHERISEWRRLVPEAEKAALAVLLALVLLPGTVRLIIRESRRARPDPRIEMTKWINENVPPGERIVLEPGGAFPATERITADRTDFLGRETPATYLSRGMRFLAGAGRERLVRGKEAYRYVFTNLAAIRESSEIVWSRDRYVIYWLLRGLDWEDSLRALLTRGDPQSARALLETTAASEPATPYLLKELSSLRLQLGDTASAVQGYRSVAEMDTTDVETPLILSDLALRAGDWDEALRQLAASQRISPRAHLIFHNLAVAYLYRAQHRLGGGDEAAAYADWMRARENAAVCAKVAPSDPDMIGIKDQVDRMGRKWGFEEGTRP